MLSEKIKELAKYAGRENEVNALEEMIDYLNNNKIKNIAILGETNCGKTTLINKLAGTEVRKPTVLSLGEEPLKVIFNAKEEETSEYEVINIDDPGLAELGIAFHEIPINMAIDYDSRQANAILEKMDAVIYVMSAIMPFTASDAANISAIVSKFPIIIYISKTDRFEDDNEYRETIEYIKNEFADRFEGSFCEFFDGNNDEAVRNILDIFKDMELEELREYHVTRVEQQAKEIVAAALNQELEKLAKEKRAKEQELAAAEDAYRQECLQWNEIRLSMMEKEQEVVDFVDKKLSVAKIAAKQDMVNAMEKASGKKAWIQEEFRPALEVKLEEAANTAVNEAKDMVSCHTAWLISEVNRRFNKKIAVKDMKYSGTRVAGGKENCDESYDYRKLLLAAGSGIVAGGVILSNVPLIPTCIVAIPASMLTVAFIKGSMDDYGKYNKSLKKFVEDCCEKHFTKLTKQVNENMRKHYEKMIEDIRRLSDDSGYEVDFGGIQEREDAVKKALNELG